MGFTFKGLLIGKGMIMKSKHAEFYNTNNRLQMIITTIYYFQHLMFMKARLCNFPEINNTITARVPVNLMLQTSQALKINATQST